MITIKQRGNFKKATNFIERTLEGINLGILNKYGRMGVEALSAATPVDSGKTASSWYYEIENNGLSATISFFNSNVNDNVQIAIILQYGHGTGTGGYVQGVDYINPAVKPVFDELADRVWKEVTKS